MASQVNEPAVAVGEPLAAAGPLMISHTYYHQDDAQQLRDMSGKKSGHGGVGGAEVVDGGAGGPLGLTARRW